MENKVKEILIELEICNPTSIKPYFSKVRDRDDVSVLRCEKSGVILLSRTDHMEISHYEEKDSFKYWGEMDRKGAIKASTEDTERRLEQFKDIITNKKWIDIGTGAGGILDALSPYALETHAVEPQTGARKELEKIGYAMYRTINEIPKNYFEIVTLFHVFEHFTEPLNSLIELHKAMQKGAKIIIEIPHAQDFLISFLNNEAFKKFTFWSEHIILHTRKSIEAFLKKAGFNNIIVSGFQRYPLANHLHWLAHDKPGGHIKWSELRSIGLDTEYANMLSTIDKTDTLIITAEK